MPFPVRAVQVLIASPGDLRDERDSVEKALHRWNEQRSEESRIVLLPRRWETGSVPITGQGDAQSVINAQLVDTADIVLALFYSKLGSPTDRAVSGTAEEIERSSAAGKPVHVYFSTRDLPNPLDTGQFDALQRFRRRLQESGLIGTFADQAELDRVVHAAIEHDLKNLEPVESAFDTRLPLIHQRLVDTFVDTALFLHDDHNGRKEISERLQPLRSSGDADRRGKKKPPLLIPTRYHYSTEAAAELWLARSSDQGPRSHQRKTNEFWKGDGGTRFTDLVLRCIGNATDLDFISLGPGDGTKDAHMALRWIDSGVDLTYYPYDASPKLAAAAVNRVAAYTRGSRNADRLQRILVMADFRDLPKVKQIFQRRPARNVVSLLGNLGNIDDDVGFLQDLQHIMDEEDLLLLEVRLKSTLTVKDLTPEESLRHDFGPLEYYMGMDWLTYKSGVTASFSTTKSEIKRTKTLVTAYKGPVPEFVGSQLATLQYIHFYEHRQFIEKVEEIGFKVLRDEPGPDNTFLVCLLQRAGPK